MVPCIYATIAGYTPGRSGAGMPSARDRTALLKSAVGMVQRPGAPRRNVRISLIGERDISKISLVSEEYAEEVPSKVEEITIPMDITPEQVPTHIVDYSVFAAVEQTEDQLAEEIQKAHLICTVYSVDDKDTLDTAASY